MIPVEHKEAVIGTGIAFMRSITETYGSDEGMKLWDVIASTLDPDVKGEIFFALLTGNINGEIRVTGLTSGGSNNYIQCIKTVREVTGWGLKEAKDFVDYVRDGQSKVIPVNTAANREQYVRKLRDNGMVVQ